MRPRLPARADGPIGIGLWGLFGLLVLAGGSMFLRACGTQPGFVWVRNFCPAPPDHSRMVREAEIGEGLQRQVHAAEMRLAAVPPCPPPLAVPPPAPRPPLQPQQRAESQTMDRRVERRGGKRGKLQLTLSWATTDDLDINVDCPGGQISSFAGHRGPGLCGDGIKDIDANGDLVRNVSSTPIENVSWAADVPDGAYLITIIQYKAHAQGGDTVPFTLRMRWGDEERICHDVVAEWPPSRTGARAVSSSTGPIARSPGEPATPCPTAHSRSSSRSAADARNDGRRPVICVVRDDESIGHAILELHGARAATHRRPCSGRPRFRLASRPPSMVQSRGFAP